MNIVGKDGKKKRLDIDTQYITRGVAWKNYIAALLSTKASKEKLPAKDTD